MKHIPTIAKIVIPLHLSPYEVSFCCFPISWWIACANAQVESDLKNKTCVGFLSWILKSTSSHKCGQPTTLFQNYSCACPDCVGKQGDKKIRRIFANKDIAHCILNSSTKGDNQVVMDFRGKLNRWKWRLWSTGDQTTWHNMAQYGSHSAKN